jgi:transcriptional regulator with XRE-family HTH domain
MLGADGASRARGDAVAEPPVTFALALRKLRAEARLTQEELAEAAGLSPRSVSDLERGIATTPRRDTVRLLADALQLTGPTRAGFEAVARGRPVPADARPAAPISAAVQVARPASRHRHRDLRRSGPGRYRHGRRAAGRQAARSCRARPARRVPMAPALSCRRSTRWPPGRQPRAGSVPCAEVSPEHGRSEANKTEHPGDRK